MKSIYLAVLFSAVSPVWAQKFVEPSHSQKDLQETGRILKQAQSNRHVEASRLEADRTEIGRLGALAAEAQTKLSGAALDDERKKIEAVERKLEPVLRETSPEGRAIIAQSATPPAMRAPDPDAPVRTAPAVKALPVETHAKAPEAKKAAPAEKPPSDIDIKSEGAVYLDSTQAIAVFTEAVVMDHPQFHMTCDKLEAFFIKESDQKPAEKPAEKPGEVPKAQPANGSPAPPQSGDAKLKQAIATGRKVVVNKLDENGEPQIGVCRKLTYFGDSGDVKLEDMPQVQRGNNVTSARDPKTYMVMKQSGELKVFGPAETKIKSNADSIGKPKPESAAPTPATQTPPVAGAPVLSPKKPAKK